MTTCTKVVLYVPWIAVRARACRTGASDARALCDARRAVRAPKVKDNIQTVIVGTNKVLVQTARPKDAVTASQELWRKGAHFITRGNHLKLHTGSFGKMSVRRISIATHARCTL